MMSAYPTGSRRLIGSGTNGKAGTSQAVSSAISCGQLIAMGTGSDWLLSMGIGWFPMDIGFHPSLCGFNSMGFSLIRNLTSTYINEAQE
jgi:hypothetical protein